MMNLAVQFLLAMFATCGFCIIFRVPVNKIIWCMLIGGFGWVAYQLGLYYGNSPAVSCFIGSCVVGILSNVASRFIREASTIFIIPSIICLVPGSNIYYTMESLLHENTGEFASHVTTTLLMAGTIAAGLLITGSITQMIRSIARKTLKTK
ncbi:MAG: threonine/serine exporter family protein [Lentihominibacter sp.]